VTSPPTAGDAAADADPAGDADVVCLGESMVTFHPDRPGPLADVPVFHRGIGGAESNVACCLARCGHRVRWVSRVGADGFGDHLLARIAEAGVDVSAVERDPGRPTGIYFKEHLPGRTGVAYYRAGSAASAMGPATVGRGLAWSGRILHLTGITPALSGSCRDLVHDLTERVPGRPLVSFDVNHRPALWRDGRDPRTLLDVARRCDIVFVGEDEAAVAFGLPSAADVRAALPEPPVLVVKQGPAGATMWNGAATTFEPSLRVDVVEPVGAGDAFAAGFLSATLRGLPDRERLRHGHVLAAGVLTVPEDLAHPPPRAACDRLVALDDGAWGALRLGPGWTEAAR
jgi:2-dehydro-3-deoxygluconokinase